MTSYYYYGSPGEEEHPQPTAPAPLYQEPLYPPTRYYYDRGVQQRSQKTMVSDRSDGQVKSDVVNRLRDNVHTKDHKLTVNVHGGAVVLEGDVSSALAKRAAGDDAWDTPGVVDVSNQLHVRHSK